MRWTRWRWAAGAAASLALVAMPGCELLVQFDRSQIDGGGGGDDGSVTDATVSDGPTSDAPAEATSDGGLGDAPIPVEAGFDEGAFDVGVDAPDDGPAEGADALVDAPGVLGEGGVDGGDAGSSDDADSSVADGDDGG